jgi:hypothetical protein
MSLVFQLTFLKWVSRSILPLPFSYLASFQCDLANSVAYCIWLCYITFYVYLKTLDYFHIPGNVPKLDKWKIKMMMMSLCAWMKFIMFLCVIISSSSWSVFIRHILFSLFGPNIFLKIFLSNTNSLLIMVSFNIHVSHEYVTIGLIYVSIRKSKV